MIEFTISATSPRDHLKVEVSVSSKKFQVIETKIEYATGRSINLRSHDGGGFMAHDFDVNPHSVEVDLEFLLAHENLVRTIALYMGRKARDKGYVWSEMRMRCEISVKEESTVWILTYKMTGKDETKLIFDKTPGFNINSVIASILTQ